MRHPSNGLRVPFRDAQLADWTSRPLRQWLAQAIENGVEQVECHNYTALDIRQPSSIVALALQLWQLGKYSREPLAILLPPLGVQARFLQVGGRAGRRAP